MNWLLSLFRKKVILGDRVFTFNTNAKTHCDNFGWKIVGSKKIMLWSGNIITPVSEVKSVNKFLEETDKILDGAGYSLDARKLAELRITARYFLEDTQ